MCKYYIKLHFIGLLWSLDKHFFLCDCHICGTQAHWNS